MGATVIGALRVALGLDTATFEAGSKKAEARAYLLGERIGKSMRGAADGVGKLTSVIGILGGAAALGGLTAVAGRALDYASSLAEVAQQLGVTTKDLQTYRFAASQVGISQEEMDKGLSKLTVTMGKARAGVKEPVEAFRTLSGLLGKDVLKGAQTAGDAIPLIAEALAKIPDPSRRAALEVALFGKTGQKLDTLLSGGAAAVNQLVASAQQLGLVLTDEQIQHADDLADRLAALKQVLEANIAGAVANNADAILSLANAFATLVVNIGKGIEAYSNWKNIQGFRADDARAALNLTRTQSGRDTLLNDINDQLADNQRQRAAGRGKPTSYLGGAIKVSGPATPADNAALDREYRRLVSDRNNVMRIDAAANRPRAPRAPTPGAGAGEVDAETKAAAAAAAKEARERAAAAKRANADERAYQSDLTRQQTDELQAKQDLTVDAFERRNIDRQLLEQQRVAQRDEIDTNEHYSAEQKAKLKALVDVVTGLRMQRLDQEQEAQLAQDALKRAQDRGANQIDLWQAESDLVRTAKERRAVELRILDKQFELERLAQQAIVDNKGGQYNQDEIGAARDRLKTLDQLQPLAQASVMRQTAGPIDSFLDGIPDSAAQANEALQNIAVDGLSSLDDGILGVIKGAKSMADVFENVADQIISALLKIAIQQAVIKPLGGLIGGLFGGGSSLASPSVDIDSLARFFPPRAKGGPVTAGKSYLVGELRPEIFTPSSSGRIIPNDDIGGGKGTVINQAINFSGTVDVASRTEVYRIAAATKQSAIDAMRNSNRRSG